MFEPLANMRFDSEDRMSLPEKAMLFSCILSIFLGNFTVYLDFLENKNGGRQGYLKIAPLPLKVRILLYLEVRTFGRENKENWSSRKEL